MSRFVVCFFMTYLFAWSVWAADAQISAKAGKGGAIVPSGKVVLAEGVDQVFQIFPVNAAAYEIVDVRVDGVSKGPVSSYEFVGVSGKHKIDAKFALRRYGYVVTNKNPAGGSLKPAVSGSQFYGKKVVIQAKPIKALVASIRVDGVVVATSNYGKPAKFNLIVSRPHSIEAAFSERPENLWTYRVVVNSNAGGAVSPSWLDVLPGGSAVFNIASNSGYAVDSVSGCNGYLADNAYMIDAVDSDCSIDVSFKPVPVIQRGGFQSDYCFRSYSYFCYKNITLPSCSDASVGIPEKPVYYRGQFYASGAVVNDEFSDGSNYISAYCVNNAGDASPTLTAIIRACSANVYGFCSSY